MNQYSFEQLFEGQQETLEVCLREQDISQFALLSGDVSPIHVDADYARERGFPGCVAHGALLSAYVSRLIGTQLPGRAGLLQKLDMQFRKPCFAGDTLRIRGEIVRKIDSVRAIQIAVTIENIATGETVANGKAQSGIAVLQRETASA